jgi:amidohydrolase
MTAEHLKSQVCDAIDSMKDELLRLSHQIHQDPELAFQEVNAAAALTAALDNAGLAPTRGAFGLDTAYATDFGNKTDAGVVSILSEYDALPGIGHACGHNIIATTGLGAAIALSKLGGDLPGRVRYLGTPAEERGGGKEIMAQAGAFDGVDASMMVHPSGLDIRGMPSIANAMVEVEYHGASAHAAAMPHKGVNALDALVLAYQSVAALRQHIRPTERVHGIITKGGAAPNIVPDHVAAFFYVRAADAKRLSALKVRVQNCFEAGALASGARLETRWSQVDYLEIKPNPPLEAAYEANAKVLGRNLIDPATLPSGFAGSTDMGNISHRVPSIHPMISSAPPNVVIHNPEFAKWAASEKGDAAVLDGAKSLAMTAIDYLTDAPLRDAAKSDFAKTADVSSQAVGLAFDPEGVMDVGGCGCC